MAKKRHKKKSKKFLFVVIFLIVICCCLASFTVLKFYDNESTKIAYYKSFNIEIPGNYSVHGIDISKHQGYIHWNVLKNVKAGNVKVDFAFIKATEGLRNVDKQFSRNWKQAGIAKIPRGAYHFFIPTKSGTTQAQNFIKTVTLSPGDLPPVLDIEQLYGASPENMRKEIRIWLQQVEDNYNVKPILYTYIDFYEKYLGSEFDDYPLWIAHYLQKERPRINRKWNFWQHSEEGNISGIKTKVDFNVFNGDMADFEDLLIK